MNNNILPIIIVFHPDINLLQNNINHILEGCNKILIWDNTPGGAKNLQDLAIIGKIEILSKNENIGISKAINYAALKAQNEGYEYILTMDQDSIFHNTSEYIESSLSFMKHNQCVIGPSVISNSHTTNRDNQIYEVNEIITSGAVIPVKLFHTVGGFNELFFVDAIDIEFCIRARKYGYKIYQNNFGQLQQRFGEPQKHILFGHKFTTSNYSPFRLYGIFRNHILIGRIYGWNKYIVKVILNYYRTFIPKILLCESAKWSKMKAIFKGSYDGITLKLNKS